MYGLGVDDVELADLATEARNRSTLEIDSWPTEVVVSELVRQQLEACKSAFEQAIPAMTIATTMACERLRSSDSRLIYVGAGTPGRLAAADAAELLPTFGFPASRVAVLLPSTNEDETTESFAGIGSFRGRDVVIGIAASGRTPFVVSTLSSARDVGSLTVSIANNVNSPLGASAEVSIVLPTGAEPIAGSTRMSAGLAQKLALATLSTAIMVGLGRTASNLMIHLQPTVSKLNDRAVRIVGDLTGLSLQDAAMTLDRCDGNVAVAVVCALADRSPDQARAILQRADFDMRRVFVEIG